MYRGVEVRHLPKVKPSLTIVENGIQREFIDLTQYRSQDELHTLFFLKGFRKLTLEEIRKVVDRKDAEHQEEGMRRVADYKAKKKREKEEQEAYEKHKKENALVK